MINERRRALRVFVKLPIMLDGGKGVTRDVNASGVYFESDVECVAGSDIRFSMEFDNPGFPKMTWDCKGVIMRVEHQRGRAGIAARITEFSLLNSSEFSQGAVFT